MELQKCSSVSNAFPASKAAGELSRLLPPASSSRWGVHAAPSPRLESTPVPLRTVLDQVMSVCDKEDSLLVGCQGGGRSIYATTDLLKADFKKVSNMGGGYLAWVENGFPTTKPLN